MFSTKDKVKTKNRVKFEKKEKYKRLDKDKEIKISRINIDSRHKNTESKNILEGDVHYLDINPLTIMESNDMETEVIIKHIGHSFKINDNIILQGIKSNVISINNGITFIGNSTFARINHKNHNLNFLSINKMSVTISNFIGNSNGNTTFNNIPTNIINTIHEIYAIKDPKEIVSNDYYYIDMVNVISNFSSTYNLSSIKITFNDINGIHLNLLNANYPIDNNQISGYHTIINVDDNTYTISLNVNNNITIENVGGDKIWVAKVNGFIQGYLSNNNYKISLKKAFRNIKEIRLISTEFPNTEQVIKSSGVKQNNKFYWKHENDGDTVYSIDLESGNYSISLLQKSMETKINMLKRDPLRIINLNTTKYSFYEYNQCSINIEPRTNLFEIQFFTTIFIANGLSFRSGTNYQDKLSRLIVSHPNHRLIEGNTIQIINAISTNSIPQEVLNNNFTIEKVINDDSYQIKLPIYNISSSNTDITNGGSSMAIKFPIRSQLLFDKSDTVGSLIGFRNVGKENAVTNYGYLNSNMLLYMNDHLSSGRTINNTINLSGDNYIIMSSPIFNDSFNSGDIDHIFAKILLTDEPGSVIYNEFIQMGQFFNPPLSELSEWHAIFYDANGELFDFGNLTHSYTIEIYEIIN